MLKSTNEVAMAMSELSRSELDSPPSGQVNKLQVERFQGRNCMSISYVQLEDGLVGGIMLHRTLHDGPCLPLYF